MKGSFRDLLDAAPDAMIVVNPQGTIVLVNVQTETLFGYKRDELVGQRLEILVPPRFRTHHQGDRDQFFAHPRKRAMGSGVDLVGLRKDGSEFPADITLSPIETEEGIVVLSSVRDITERKQNEEIARQNSELKIKMVEETARLNAAKKELEIAAERERSAETLRRSQTRIRRLVESSIIGIATGDLNGKLIDANDALLQILGFTREDVLSGQVRWDALTPPEYHDTDQQAVERLKRTGVAPPWEKQFFRKDGSRVSVLIGVVTLEAESGEIEAITFILDISERKQLEQQLRQAQKMESIGQLAGGVAHDFNNLLSVIIGYSEIFLEGSEHDEKDRKQVEEIHKAGRRAASLTRQLLAFSRQQVLEPRVLNLNTSVREIEKMLRRLIGEDIDLRTNLEPTLGAVKADPGQIEQVIMNLAVNARDAMPQGGTLVIETANADLDDEYAHQHQPMAAGRYVLLSVTDNGVGMSPETKARIFEPFFTTKEIGKGTGLGLSTVYGVVKQTGGFIWVYSEPGHGSTFKIYLPRADGSEPQIPIAESQPSALRGTETVLLVEDEQAVRTLTRTLMEQSGYTVLEADGGPRALEIAERHRGPIHLLLTDVVMPGMNGSALAGKILAIHPEAQTLYISGYSSSFGTHTGLVPAGANLLQKPFSRTALLQKLRDALTSNHTRTMPDPGGPA